MNNDTKDQVINIFLIKVQSKLILIDIWSLVYPYKKASSEEINKVAGNAVGMRKDRPFSCLEQVFQWDF